MDYTTLKWLHVLSSTVLFGTGIGSAYYLLATSLSRRAQAVAVVARQVVRADFLFTASTAVLQPLTGWLLLRELGLPWSTPWVAWASALYVLAIACWLPVVWIQIRMRDLAEQAAEDGDPLPPAYFRLLRTWTVLGVPALAAFLAVFWLMVSKPAG